MENSVEIQVKITSESPEKFFVGNAQFDFDKIIFDLDSKIEMFSSQADALDYIVAAASGVLCAALDILWVGEFSLENGRNTAADQTDKFVKRTAKFLGCSSDDLKSCVKFLEEKFPLASDGNTPGFGGGLQHHLRDFAHHPTLVGLIFSLLTQFTYKSYGTDCNGNFLVLDVPEKSRIFIGEDVSQKILYGTIIWFFHLVSDVAGSSSTAGLTGGTGIPGPLLSLAKEISAIPCFQNKTVNEDTLSSVLSKLFNGTLLAQHDSNGKIIKDTVLKFDFRGELGVDIELERQSIPVIANECFVRAFYFLRRLAMEIRAANPHSIEEIRQIPWSAVEPRKNPTISRMLAVSIGVFTTIDIGESVVSQKYWIGINYSGVGRFAIAIGEDISWCLKRRNVKEIRAIYEKIKKNTYNQEDQNIYERIGKDMEFEKLGLTLEQTEILYNLEFYKTLNDAQKTKMPVNGFKIQQLKLEWLNEWKTFISSGFSSFTQEADAKMHWYSKETLIKKVEENEPYDTWFRLVLLEVMLFEPYYPLKTVKDKKENEVPDPKYRELQGSVVGYKEGIGDAFLENFFEGDYYQKGYIKRLRKCYSSVLRELNEVLKTAIKSIVIGAGIMIVTVATAGAFAPTIAVALVGSNFAGLSGAALTSACLAYLGGGAIAIGGAGMAGGTIAIVGGGAALGLGVGAGLGGAVGAVSLSGKKGTILQSAKLMVSVREIFLNDDHDVAYSNSILEKYVQNITEIEKGLVELRLKADVADKEEKKKLKAQIKSAEDSVEAMKIARKSMAKFVSSYETGLNHNEQK